VTPANANPKLQNAKWLRTRYVDRRMTVAAIAAEAGADPSRVHVALRRHGIPPRGPADRDMRPMTRADIKRAYKGAESKAAAARSLGVHPDKLRNAELRLGTVAHPLTDEAARLYETGLSIPDVAKALEVSPRTVSRILPPAIRRPRGRPKAPPPAPTPKRKRPA
jgi:hypothetical protein